MFKREAGLNSDRVNPSSPLPHENFSIPSVARNAYLNFRDMQVAPSVRQLHQILPPVTRSALCSDVLTIFMQDKSIYAIPVIDEAGVPHALIERHAILNTSVAPIRLRFSAGSRSRKLSILRRRSTTGDRR